MTMNPRNADCHAHIIDLKRFPVPGGRGYKPTQAETGTREDFCATLDRHGLHHGLLVQLSGYGTDNAPILDAVAAYPDRFKAIAVIDAGMSDRKLEDMARAGVVGVRFNLPSYDPGALSGPEVPRLLDRIKAIGWVAQVYATDAQWAEAAPVLSCSGVRVVVDHFGVHDPAGGIAQPGFQQVLRFGRDGRSAVKLSSMFRVSKAVGYRDLDVYVEALVAAFGVGNCLWGSDWPFVGVSERPDYPSQLAPLERWFPDAKDRVRVLAENPARLFGFGRD